MPGDDDYLEDGDWSAGLRPGSNAKPATSPGRRPAFRGVRRGFALVTLIPLAWLLAVTFTAGVEKIFHPDPRIGFLAQAKSIEQQLPGLQSAHTKALQDYLGTGVKTGNDSPETISARAKADETWLAVTKQQTLRFNNLLDACVAGAFLILVGTIVCVCVREWFLLLSGRKSATLRETEPVWLPDYALKESGPNLRTAAGAAAIALGLAKESYPAKRPFRAGRPGSRPLRAPAEGSTATKKFLRRPRKRNSLACAGAADLRGCNREFAAKLVQPCSHEHGHNKLLK